MRVITMMLCIFVMSFTINMTQAEQLNSHKGKNAVIQEATGDLDKDGVPERVVIVNGVYRKDTGAVREIRIFKNSNNDWVLWHKSIGAVLSEGESQPGEDAFDTLRIERGCIVIEHGFGAHGIGGLYTHRFRYQHGDWYLIGVTHTEAAPCSEDPGYNELETYDFNLSTNALFVEYEYESCEDAEEHIPDPKNMPRDTTFTLKIDKFHNIKMDGYEIFSRRIGIPGFNSKELIF